MLRMANSAPFVVVRRDTGEIDKFQPAADRDSDGFAFVSNVASNVVVTPKTSAYTAHAGEAVRADSTGGSFNITAPAPVAGAALRIRNNGSGNTVTLVGSGGGDTVDVGAVAATSGALFLSDGVNWYRF